MSSPVKLAGALPAGDANGLAAHTAEFVDAPDEIRVLIMLVSTKELKTSIVTGEVTPTLCVRRAEVVPDDDLAQAKKFFRRAHEHRTGRVALPIDVEDELNEAFKTEA